MIELKMISPEPQVHTNFEIYINGKKYTHPEIKGHLRNDEKSSFMLELRSTEVIEQFISHKMSEVPATPEYIRLKFRPNYGFDLEFLEGIYISERYERKYNEPGSKREYELVGVGIYEISFDFDPDLTEWKKEYSVTDYYTAYSKVFEKVTDSSIDCGLHDPEGGIQHGFFTRFTDMPLELPIAEVIENHLTLLRQLHSEAEAEIADLQNQNSVTISIEVPDEIRAPYSQYITYFSQFLKDLGVESTSELHNEASNILFTITPTDSSQALDKIRAALEIYLCLPNSPVSDYPEISTGIEVQRLTANIHHLKSQLSLVRAQNQLNEAMLEAKDVTIQALRYTIIQQKQLLNGDISSAIIDITPAPQINKKEDLLEGIVSLTKYEGQGFEINFAEIFRRLKEFIKKDR